LKEQRLMACHPCESDRSGKHFSKSPAFKNATAGAVGYTRLLDGGLGTMFDVRI